jgi:carboxyl-terminal processing protease
VRLEVSRAGRPFLVVLRRAQVQAQDVSSELRHVAGVSVGYVQVVEFSDGVGQKARDAVTDLRRRGATRIVLDLRQNGGGLVSEAVALAAVFRPLGSTVLSESGQHFDATTYRTKASPADATVPVAVLVDDQTASAAEIVTGALQDSSRALVVGTRTFGKGVVQDLAPLQGGGALKYTMAEYLTPNGHHVNHVGITPDVTVQPATGGTGTDPVFDAAVQDLG